MYVTIITNNIRCTSQTRQIYYGIQGQVNDNMFQPFTLIRPSSGQARKPKEESQSAYYYRQRRM